MLLGCIPSHAAYFSVFEAMKESTGANQPGHHPVSPSPRRMPPFQPSLAPSPSQGCLGGGWLVTCAAGVADGCGVLRRSRHDSP
jgi:hypothetical protein